MLRVLRERRRAFAEIEQVNLRVLCTTAVLSFRFTGSAFTFDASHGSPVLARQVLELLPRGVPLSGPASALRRGS